MSCRPAATDGGAPRARGRARRCWRSPTTWRRCRGYYYQLLAGAGWTSLPLLHRPTLLLAGADDPLIPLINGHIMHRLIPGSELVVYPGGHLDLVAEPHRLAPVIERFLRAPGPADPALAGRKAVS
jgi:pimeloyl-ACP methyl ester carboxylesterase